MSLARSFAQRQFPRAAIDEVTECTFAKIDHQIQIIFGGMVGQIYMHGKKLVADPGSPENFIGGPNDVARLFLARGLKCTDETVIPYDDNNPVIQQAQEKLAEEVRLVFFPKILEISALDKHFESQKKAVLRFLTESSEPFPEGKFFSELIAAKYRENILPLRPKDSFGSPLPDWLAVQHREAMDKLNQVLGNALESMSGSPQPASRTSKTQPASGATAPLPDSKL